MPHNTIDRSWLIQALEQYSTFDNLEATFQQDTLAFVKSQSDCFSRSLAIGHITASAWIINEENTQALLIHHKKLDRWLQPGGHIEEGDSSVLNAALREAQEESGLKALRPLLDTPFDIDIHAIPTNKKEAGHLHYDIRFLLQASHHAALEISHESNDLRWFSYADIRALQAGPSIERMIDKQISNK